jgi:hypothetical protein
MKERLVLTSLSALSVEDITSGAASQPPRDHPETPSQTPEPTQAEFDALLEDSARFREGLLRRYDEPYPDSWLHGGLND